MCEEVSAIKILTFHKIFHILAYISFPNYGTLKNNYRYMLISYYKKVKSLTSKPCASPETV